MKNLFFNKSIQSVLAMEKAAWVAKPLWLNVAQCAVLAGMLAVSSYLESR